MTSVLHRIDSNVEASSLTYVLGQERVVPGSGGQMGAVAERIFAALSRNAANPSDFFDLPVRQVVELGARIDL